MCRKGITLIYKTLHYLRGWSSGLTVRCTGRRWRSPWHGGAAPTPVALLAAAKQSSCVITVGKPGPKTHPLLWGAWHWQQTQTGTPIQQAPHRILMWWCLRGNTTPKHHALQVKFCSTWITNTSSGQHRHLITKTKENSNVWWSLNFNFWWLLLRYPLGWTNACVQCRGGQTYRCPYPHPRHPPCCQRSPGAARRISRRGKAWVSAQQNFDNACGGIGMQCLRKFSICTSVLGNIYMYLCI